VLSSFAVRFSLAICGLFFLSLFRLSAATSPLIVVQHATLIDGTGAKPRPDTTIVIRNGRFQTVSAGGTVELPSDARIIDATGKFAIPGLWDMHVHLTQSSETACPALIANGVTGVRDMGGSLELVDWIRQRIEDGTIVGPQIFRAGPFVDGAKPGIPDRLVVRTAEDGRKAVDFLRSRGVDLIKVHNGTPPEAFFAVLKEAASRQIQVGGHIPLEVDPAAAIAAGYNTIEHVVSLFEGPVKHRLSKANLKPKRWPRLLMPKHTGSADLWRRNAPGSIQL
jgi:hypothetical protein